MKSTALLVVLFAAVALASRSAHGGGTQVAFSPPSVNVDGGATVAIDITVAGVPADPGLGSYDLILRFDPAVVRLESLADSGFITSGENVVICVTGAIDNTNGSVNAVCTAIPLFGAPGVSTTNAVALLHASFTTLAAGTSPLTLSGSLSGPDGEAIAATFSAGSIHVSSIESATSPAAEGAMPTIVSARGIPPAGTGGAHRDSGRIFTIALLSGLVAIGIAGASFAVRRLRRDTRT